MPNVRHTSRILLVALAAVALGCLILAGATSGTKPPIPQVAPAIKTGPTGRVALAGPWTVRMDPRALGTGQGWDRGRFSGRVVDLPFSPNAHKVTGEAGRRSFLGSVAWYRHTFGVEEDGEYALRFESVNHRATIWLDGRRIGTHTGEYLPFELHARLAADRKHTLVVRADYRDPYKMKREAWHRTWFNFGGINREVTIRPLGASTLSAPNLQTRLVRGATEVTVGVRVRNRAAARTIKVTGALTRGDARVPLDFAPVALARGGATVVRTRVQVPDAALWEPGAPNLYDLELDVPGEAGYRAPVGLREIKRRDGTLLLNGRRLTLHGASLHEDVRKRGDALLPRDMDSLVDGLKQIGANATRSQHPLNPALLERLDAAGIVVWQGVGPVDAPGAWTSVTPRLQAQSAARVRATLFQQQTHPSIVVWNLANEVAGQGHSGGQAGYIDAMARELHRRDPGRLVAVDIWGPHGPRGFLGPLYRNIDAIGFTNYVGWYELPLRRRRRGAGPARRADRRGAPHVQGQDPRRHRVRRRGEQHEPPARAGRLPLPGQPAAPAHRHLPRPRGRPRRHARLGPARLRPHPRVRRRLDPPRGPRHPHPPRHQPEGPHRLLGRREAVAGHGQARVRAAGRRARRAAAERVRPGRPGPRPGPDSSSRAPADRTPGTPRCGTPNRARGRRGTCSRAGRSRGREGGCRGIPRTEA